jgi:Holliday junction resolvase RusA-like endonuclease
MAAMINFFVPGIPISMPRPRCRCLMLGRRPVPQLYTPKENGIEEWKAKVAIIGRQNAPKAPWTGPCRLVAVLLLPRIQKHYRKAGLRPDAPMWHTAKPDTDNFTKAIKDALEGIVWANDSLVCDEQIKKLYTNDGKPGCLISVEEIEPVVSPLLTDFINDILKDVKDVLCPNLPPEFLTEVSQLSREEKTGCQSPSRITSTIPSPREQETMPF